MNIVQLFWSGVLGNSNLNICTIELLTVVVQWLFTDCNFC